MSESPDPGPSRGLRLRPLPLSELLDEAIRMYRSEFPIFFLVALVVGLPSLLFSVVTGSYKATGGLLSSIASGAVNNPGSAPTFVTPVDFNPVPLIVVAIAVIVAVPFIAGGLTAAAVSVAEGGQVTFGDVVGRVRNRYWAIWGIGFLEGLAAVGLAIVAVVPFIIPVVGFLVALLVVLPLAIYIFIHWAVALPVMFAEGVGPTQALRRSWSLIRGNFWRVFAILFFAGILVAILAAALGFALGIVAFVIPGLSADNRGAVSVVARTIATAAVSPVSAVITTLIYYDLRVRMEAVDLDQLARDAGLPPGPVPPPAPMPPFPPEPPASQQTPG